MELGTILTALIIVFVVTLLVVVWVKGKPKTTTPKLKRGVEYEAPYESFLNKTLVVFSAGKKENQQLFLEQKKDEIKKYSIYPDFINRFDAIIKRYGK